jgi:hypothetical protein
MERPTNQTQAETQPDPEAVKAYLVHVIKDTMYDPAVPVSSAEPFPMGDC